jgi:hypothetical protein
LTVGFFAVGLAASSSDAEAQQVTQAFCKAPATERAVEADAKLQRLLRALLQIKSVRFEYVDATKRGRFCAFRIGTTNEDTFEFAATPAGERGGVRRFKFRHLD